MKAQYGRNAGCGKGRNALVRAAAFAALLSMAGTAAPIALNVDDGVVSVTSQAAYAGNGNGGGNGDVPQPAARVASDWHEEDEAAAEDSPSAETVRDPQPEEPRV